MWCVVLLCVLWLVWFSLVFVVVWLLRLGSVVCCGLFVVMEVVLFCFVYWGVYCCCICVVWLGGVVGLVGFCVWNWIVYGFCCVGYCVFLCWFVLLFVWCVVLCCLVCRIRFLFCGWCRCCVVGVEWYCCWGWFWRWSCCCLLLFCVGGVCFCFRLLYWLCWVFSFGWLGSGWRCLGWIRIICFF